MSATYALDLAKAILKIVPQWLDSLKVCLKNLNVL